MEEKTYTIDNAPVNGFHKRVVAFTMGGSFIDGYILGIIEVALLYIIPAMDMSSSWQGLIGSSPLIGVFIGSLFFGKLSDNYGRQNIYKYNFVVLVIASVLQFFVNTAMPLFILRLILGIVIGAEYAIGPAILTEFVPTRLRGMALATLNVAWTVGYVLSVVIGYAMEGLGDNCWRWMLSSSAVFGIVILIIRMGMPESPRWLVLHGKTEEAKKVVQKFIGQNVTIDDLLVTKEEHQEELGYKHLFTGGMWKKTLFCAIIWLSGVIPLFGIFTFLPSVLNSLGIENESTGVMLINLFQLLGAIVAVFIVDRFSRKKLCAWTLLISGAPLFLLGIWSSAGGFMVVLLFGIYIFFGVIAGTLSGFVYPSEVFPTEIRSSGIGFCSAISRIGSAAGTFLVPVLTESAGIGAVLIGMGIFQLLAVVVTVIWGPETRNVSVN